MKHNENTINNALLTIKGKLQNRIKVLTSNEKEYVADEYYIEAHNCKMKRNSFQLVLNDVNDKLNNI